MSIQFKEELVSELVVRIVLWFLFIWLDHVEPFIRIIHPEEVWLYQYPVAPSYVPSTTLWLIVFSIPISLIIFEYIRYENNDELKNAFLSLSLNYGLVGFMIQFFKIIVGRPRPNFFYRCFPDGKGTDFENCTGVRRNFMDGRKSFPSGHSAFAFSGMMFVSLHLSRKLRIFTECGRGNSLRLCACIAPLILAASIAISRTCDYHHHWQDVLVGSLLGSTIAYVCYKQYYPKVSCCNRSYTTQTLTLES